MMTPWGLSTRCLRVFRRIPKSRPTWEVDILLYELLDRLVDRYVPILDDFQELLDKLEELAIGDPPAEFLVTHF